MKSIFSFLCIPFLMLATSCASNVPNPEPAVKAVALLDIEFTNILDSFREVIQNSSLPADKKNEVLLKLAQVSATRQEAVEALLRYLHSLTSVDIEKWTLQILDLYRTIKTETRG